MFLAKTKKSGPSGLKICVIHRKIFISGIRLKSFIYTGCVSAYYPVAQKIPMALAEIMDISEIEFALLGER